MGTFAEEIQNKNYVPNVVILLGGQYFVMREPDSGLVIPTAYKSTVQRVSFNPTNIDPLRAGATISGHSFTLLDRRNVVTAVMFPDTTFAQGDPVDVWIGRSGVGMAFTDYFQFPRAYINKWTKTENGYSFTTQEAKDRLDKGAFNNKTKLGVSILFDTVTITVQDGTALPTSGMVRIEDELISYTGVSTNNLTGCIRGEHGTTPVAHETGTDVAQAVRVTGVNPIDLLLQLLVSDGGGGAYDVLVDGAAIDESMIDVDQMEEIRDEFFSTYEFRFVISELESLRRFIEEELLLPLGIRMRSNNNGKIGLALLNRNVFTIDAPFIDDNYIKGQPGYAVNENQIYNKLRISWDYSDVTQKFLKVNDYTDTDSVTAFGERKLFSMNFQGLRSDLDGAAIVASIKNLFFARFANPRPEISVNAFMSTALLNLGDKVDLQTSVLPNPDGDFAFASTLEAIRRSINFETGDVGFQLAYTSFSGIKQCFIAPSDVVTVVTSQKIVEVASGRGVYYRAGWKMRLYDNTARDHASAQVNTIASIDGDEITFQDSWTTTLTVTQHRIMFADYDQVVDQQKRFCFVGYEGVDFADGLGPYQITIS